MGRAFQICFNYSVGSGSKLSWAFDLTPVSYLDHWVKTTLITLDRFATNLSYSWYNDESHTPQVSLYHSPLRVIHTWNHGIFISRWNSLVPGSRGVTTLINAVWATLFYLTNRNAKISKKNRQVSRFPEELCFSPETHFTVDTPHRISSSWKEFD